jgi:hypothetical protein
VKREAEVGVLLSKPRHCCLSKEGFSSKASKVNMALPTPLFQISSFQNSGKLVFLSHPVCSNLFQQPWEMRGSTNHYLSVSTFTDVFHLSLLL